MKTPCMLLWIGTLLGACVAADPLNRNTMDQIETGIDLPDLKITSIDRLLNSPEFLNKTIRTCGTLTFSGGRYLRQSDGSMIRLLGVHSSVLDVEQLFAFYNLKEGESVILIGVLSDVPWVDDQNMHRKRSQRYIDKISYIRYPADCDVEK